MALSVSIDKS